MTTAGGSKRQLQSWIASYEEFTAASGSPGIYRLWTAISCLAGAMERKVWVRTMQSDLYPNLYVLLVGGPGIGKSQALGHAERFWRGLKGHHVAPTSLTKASLIDALADAKRSIVRPGQIPPHVEFNSLLVPASELGAFLTSYENDFMNTLTTLYDGGTYAERRRTKDLKLEIPRPQLNFLGATTPSYLNAFLPAGAWDQGFLSRTILVYSGEQLIHDIFAEDLVDPALKKALEDDLKLISEAFGKMEFTPDAVEAIREWNFAKCEPVPEAPKLRYYCSRRLLHTLKLTMVASIDRSPDMWIEEQDFQRAKGWLLAAEQNMPDIFMSMQSGGDGQVMEDIWNQVHTLVAREGKPMSEARLLGIIQMKTTTHNVQPMFQNMIKSGMLELVPGGYKAGVRL